MLWNQKGIKNMVGDIIESFRKEVTHTLWNEIWQICPNEVKEGILGRQNEEKGRKVWKYFWEQASQMRRAWTS